MSPLSSNKTQQKLTESLLLNNQKYSLRDGQLALVNGLAVNPAISTAKAIFPTGYGKTDAIEFAYKLLKLQGRVNALMIIVPSKEQLSS